MGGSDEASASRAILRFSLGEEDAGERLDVTVASVSGTSRAQVRRWILDGHVTVDGVVSKPSHRVGVGEVVVATPPEPVRMAAEPEDIELAILYEDAHLIVIDKPAGMVVHPAPGHPSGTLVNALLFHCGDLAGVGGVVRPGIVHRLDRGTSGVMVAAKTDAAHQDLACQFHDHSIHRVYRAFVRSTPGKESGVVEAAIGRHPKDRKRMSIVEAGGRPALTRWCVEERFRKSDVSLLEIRPETGRTHQIRVHLASVGMPIVGDPVYGRVRKRPLLDRPALHAAELGFRHPATGEELRFTAPLPADLEALLADLRQREGTG